MLYILRLTDGDCIVVLAPDEQTARQAAAKLNTDEATNVATVRPLDNFGLRFSPTEDGSLEASHWDDATLDGILASEYPALNEAYRRANAAPFAKAPAAEPILPHLKSEFERNMEIIREGLDLERRRFNPSVRTKSKAGTG